jgi:hypothetical protein
MSCGKADGGGVAGRKGATARGGPTNSYAPLFDAVDRASGEAHDTRSAFEAVKRTTPAHAGSGEAQRQKVVKRASPKPVKNQNHTIDVHRSNARSARARGVEDGANSAFETFWRIYPHRGEFSDPKKPAWLKFEAAVRRGVDPAEIIAAAERYRARVESQGIEPRFRPHAQTWLNQERWKDYREMPEPPRLRVGMN